MQPLVIPELFLRIAVLIPNYLSLFMNPNRSEPAFLFPQGGGLAFQALFDHFYRMVYRRVYVLIRNKETAEELAADVFLDLWRRRESITAPGSWAAYLTQAATYKAIDHLRKKEPFWVDVDTAATVLRSDHADSPLMAAELETRLLAALEALPPQCREVFALSRFEQLSYREIADTLGISPKTVENQIGKALTRLRKLLLAAGAWAIPFFS